MHMLIDREIIALKILRNTHLMYFLSVAMYFLSVAYLKPCAKFVCGEPGIKNAEPCYDVQFIKR